MRTLPPPAVATLRSLGLFWLKTPAEFGGTPLTPLELGDALSLSSPLQRHLRDVLAARREYPDAPCR